MKRQTKRQMTDRESGYFDKPSKHGRDVQAGEGARQLQGRKRRLDTAIEGQSNTKSKPKSKTRQKGATSYDEAKRTKHKGSKGEAAFGQRMTPSPYGKD